MSRNKIPVEGGGQLIKWFDIILGVRLHREGYTEFLKDFKNSDNIKFGYQTFLMTMRLYWITEG